MTGGVKLYEPQKTGLDLLLQQIQIDGYGEAASVEWLIWVWDSLSMNWSYVYNLEQFKQAYKDDWQNIHTHYPI